MPMRRIAVATLVVASGLGLGAVGLGGPDGAAASRIDIDDLSFLEGRWVGTLGGTPMDEVWLPASSGNMTGCLRWFDASGQVRMLELFTLDEREDGPVRFHLRHFDGAMIGWASEADGPMSGEVSAVDDGYALVRLTTEGAGVERLEYRRAGDELRVTLHFDASQEREPLRLVLQRDG